jgi:hypothetical protein
MSLTRRAFLVASSSLLTAQAPVPDLVENVLRYRDFVMNMVAVATLPNFAALVVAMRRQIDIVADCGAKPEIMAFFRKQPMAMVVRANFAGHSGGLYTMVGGVEINPVAPPPDNPVVLHELLHALHNRYMPQSNNNPDIIRFYEIAVRNNLYPKGAYMLINRGEFFAMTGSVYLWSKAAREPHTRELLREKQPVYYAWLGELFGVKK